MACGGMKECRDLTSVESLEDHTSQMLLKAGLELTEPSLYAP